MLGKGDNGSRQRLARSRFDSPSARLAGFQQISLTVPPKYLLARRFAFGAKAVRAEEILPSRWPSSFMFPASPFFNRFDAKAIFFEARDCVTRRSTQTHDAYLLRAQVYQRLVNGHGVE